MHKVYWLNLTYDMICLEFIEKYPLRSIQILEKILFLIQEETLKTSQKPFLDTKIYIYRGAVQIKYISDLLRVTKMISSGVADIRATAIPSIQPIDEIKKMVKYKKIYEGYVALSDEEIKARVREILANEELDSRYYMFEKYKNKKLRYVARIEYNRKRSVFKNILWVFLFGLSIIFILALTLLIMLELFNYSLFKSNSEFFGVMVMVSLVLIPCIVWTKKWIKPTEYEKENHYEI